MKENFFYHVYNRGINSEPLFIKQEHYKFFLESYVYYLFPAVQTFAYVLMKNHFHFLVRIRTVDEQKELFENYKKKGDVNDGMVIPHGYDHDTFKKQTASRQFSHLFNRYSRNFNQWMERTGKLFELPFKRKSVDDESYLIHLICYIHRNLIHHHVTNCYTDYKYSSYKSMLSEKQTILELEKKRVLNWFGGKTNFIAAHHDIKLQLPQQLAID